MKKFISIILIVILTFSAFSTVNFTAYAKESNGFCYNLFSDNTAIIYDYIGTETDIVIPSELEGHIVKYIDEAFSETDIKTVVIPDSVEYINMYAFSDCKNLETVSIGNNVKIIGDYAFRNCEVLESVTIGNSVETIRDGAFYNTNLKSVAIPDSVETICNSAFHYCKALESVTIGNRVETIGGYAFAYNNLKNIDIPDSVETIGKSAFSDCKNLETVSIGNNVKNIDNHAFYNCEVLETATIGNNVITIGEYAFYNTNLKTVVIPDSVETIGYYAFSNCEKLETATIGNNVITIGNGAFSNCEKLETATIGNNVITIGDDAFYNTNLKTVVIPDSVETIGFSAFKCCNELEAVTLGNNVKSIGVNTFSNCNLKTVTINNNVKSIGVHAFSFNYNLKSIDIPDSVETIGDCSFRNCNLETITIGNNVKTIGDYAFCGTNLKSIILPDSVETIGNNAFENCNLETITIGKGLSSIGENAFIYNGSLKNFFTNDENEYFYDIDGVPFSNLTNEIIVYPSKNDTKVLTINEGAETLVDIYSEYLEEINLPSTLKNIGKIDCSNLKNINVNENNPNLYSVNGVLFSNTTNEMILPAKNTSVTLTIPEGITKLNSITSSELTEINIPSTVTEINRISSDKLENIFVSDDNPSYCDIDGVLYNKDLTSLILYPPSNTTQVLDIPETVTEISCNFDNCKNLVTINIPDNANNINPSFTNSPNLESINVGEDNTRWKSIDGVLFSKGGEILTRYPEGKKDKDYRIPDGVTTISHDGIRNLKYLENLTIPSSFTNLIWWNLGYNNMESLQNIYVEDGNPDYCDVDGVLFSKDKTILIKYPTGRKDTTYEIPSNVTTLKDLSFYGSNNLTNIEIPATIKSINNRPFLNCDNLKEITIAPEVSSISRVAFGHHLYGNPGHTSGDAYVPLENVTIKGYTNTCAEVYAKKYGFNFVSIGIGENILGDANNDKDVNIQDATLVQMCVAKYPETIETTNADIDNDGEITIRDATSIQMYVSKFIDTLYDVS